MLKEITDIGELIDIKWIVIGIVGLTVIYWLKPEENESNISEYFIMGVIILFIYLAYKSGGFKQIFGGIV